MSLGRNRRWGRRLVSRKIMDTVILLGTVM
jgi:hypothetical protein